MALATLDDFEARLGRAVTAAEEDRATALLEDASAAVQAYTGQAIATTEYTTFRIQARNGTLRLPQSPVTEVVAVTDVDGNEIDFTWDHGQVVNLSGLGYGLNGFEVEPFRNRRPFVDVTYTAGYDTVPGDIVAVVCQMAMRAFGITPTNAGMQSESIAGYSYSIGSAAASGAVGLLPVEREVLDRYRVVGGTAYMAMR